MRDGMEEWCLWRSISRAHDVISVFLALLTCTHYWGKVRDQMAEAHGHSSKTRPVEQMNVFYPTRAGELESPPASVRCHLQLCPLSPTGVICHSFIERQASSWRTLLIYKYRRFTEDGGKRPGMAHDSESDRSTCIRSGSRAY